MVAHVRFFTTALFSHRRFRAHFFLVAALFTAPTTPVATRKDGHHAYKSD